MKGRTTTLGLKCLVLAVTLAALAMPAVQARAATSDRGSATIGLRTEGQTASGKASQHHLARKQLEQGSASYFWVDAGITAGVLVGFFVLGLWGDVVIGGLIAGVGFLGAGAALIARKAYVRGRQALGRKTPCDAPTPEAPTAGTEAYAGLLRGTRL
jgi:hypothetical protein